MDQNKIHIGTSGWTYDHWKDVFYPSSLSKSKWLSYYQQHFETVEINATFYRKFQDKTYLKWRNQAPDNFRYVLKIPKTITHNKKLINVTNDLNEFFDSALLLEEKLGLLLMQLPPFLKKNINLLDTVFKNFHNRNKIAIEFRDKSWFDKETVDFCTECQIGFCNVDSYKFNLTNYITSDTGYLRFHGRTYGYQYNYSDDELKEIAKVIKKMLMSESLNNLYIFFNNDFYGHAPKNAIRLKEILT